MYTYITGTTESHLWNAKSMTVSRGFSVYSSRVVRSLEGNTESNEIARARCHDAWVEQQAFTFEVNGRYRNPCRFARAGGIA
jgi:hypothetical protein